MRPYVVACLVVAVGACAEAIRPTPAECTTLKRNAMWADGEVKRLTEAARSAVGEEAATLAWWKVREAEATRDGAQEAARGCP